MRIEIPPTKEWFIQNAGNIEEYGTDRQTRKQVGLRHKTRLHELEARGVIDESQRHYGIRLTVLYVRAGRPQLKAQALYDTPRPSSREHSLNNTIDAFFLLLDCQREMRGHWPIIQRVCLDEITMTDLSLELARRKEVLPGMIRNAMNELGEWMYKQEPGSV